MGLGHPYSRVLTNKTNCSLLEDVGHKRGKPGWLMLFYVSLLNVDVMSGVATDNLRLSEKANRTAETSNLALLIF